MRGWKRQEDVALRRVGRMAAGHGGADAEPHCGLTQREIAPLIGVGTGKAVSVQLSRLAIALDRDRQLAKQVEGVEQELKRQVEVSNASSKG